MVAVVGVNRHTAAEDFIRAKFIGLQILALLSRKYFFHHSQFFADFYFAIFIIVISNFR